MVQHFDVTDDVLNLAEPVAVVRYDHIGSAVGGAWILLSKNALYNATLVVLLVEYLGSPASVRLAAVDRTASLLDVGHNSHLEQYLAVVV